MQISNCKEQSPANPGICVACIESYYLKDNQCVLGNNKQCLVYENETVCKKCIDGFVLIDLLDRQYCLPVNTYPNCDTFDIDLLQNENKLKCNQCKSGFYPNSFLFPESVCNGFNITKNCVQYQKSFSLKQSTLRCV